MSVRTAGRATPGFCAARFLCRSIKRRPPYCVTFPSAVRRTRKRCSGRVCWTASLFLFRAAARRTGGNGFFTASIRWTNSHPGNSPFWSRRLCRNAASSMRKNALCFVPGLAFTRSGKRLGYGKGYYDTFLNRIPVCTVGLCYDFQLIEDLPTEAHDKPVSYICTDRGLYAVHRTERMVLKL